MAKSIDYKNDRKELRSDSLDLATSIDAGTGIPKHDEGDGLLADVENDTEHEPAKFEDVLHIVGGSNRFQILVYIMVNVSFEFAASCATTYFIIEGANPGWSCVKCEKYVSNGSYCSQFSANATEGSCKNDNHNCHNMTFNIQYTSIVSEWALVCNESWIAKLVASIFFVGLLVGVVVMGQISDRFGRKTSLIPCWVVLIIAQSVVSVAPSVSIYVTIRFVAGMCVGCLAANGAVLAMEFMDPKWRTVVGFRFGWQVGHCVTALMAYLLPDWRKLSLATGLISLPLLPIIVYFLPESARWYVEKQKIDQAENCLKYVAKINAKDTTGLREKLELISNAETAKKKAKSLNITYLFRTRKLAIRSVVLIYAWLATSLVFYGVSNQLSDMTGNLYLNVFISGAGVLLTRWTFVFLVNWIGRRISLLISLSIPGLCLLAIMIMDLTGFLDKNPMFVTYFGLAAYIIGAGAWCVTTYYSAELYPTLLRNTATGTGYMGARIGSIIAPQISLMSSLHESAPYVVVGAVALSSAALNFFILPETTNRPLPEDLEEQKPVRSNPKIKLIRLS
ncbi:organic anion transporter 3-like [Tubulanus polymorphus]|uniref:organic anion transporter 3-like n=1 Tax=Tubulanus polymorphus TaxID=672921 RepID=UPI003DA5AECD